MTAATIQEFVIHLPQDIIDMLQHAASERHETPDQIIAGALRFALQPMRQEALRRLQGQIRQQETESEPEIRGHLEARLTEKQQQRLSELLEKNRAETLTAEEQAEMQILFDAIEAVATEKAAAIWQLTRQRSGMASQ